MHAETKQLALKLQKMNEHKDQFLANTSHEFRNPLHGMINMSQSVLSREKHQLNNKSVHELETILTVGRRMSLLLNDLLDAASLKEGAPRLHKTNISIQPIVKGVLNMLQFTVEVKPITIVNQIPKDLPSVFADENRVIQIIYNLLHNAIKYTHHGEVCITANAKDDKVFITISDTGIGMDENFLKRLYLPYEQAADEAMLQGGLGIGLSISKQLIELHDGQLEVSSTFGTGSEFTFSLEIASQQSPTNDWVRRSLDVEQMELSTTVEPTTLIESNSRRLPILIVDDDPINLQVLQSILSAEQYEITAVANGQDALHQLDLKEWSLVISDIMMPQMSGYELTKMIRVRYSLTELPILLLTARSDPKDVQAGFLAGANDYITKPVEMLELKTRVKALTMVKKVVREQLQLEAAWLQSQIQPHFIFNTINSIMALSEIDLNKMKDMLIEFSEYLRSKFQFQHFDELIPIQEELNIVRSYLNIEQVRYEDRLQIDWKLDNNIELKIPFLTIQPLVENAIIHGIMKRAHGGKIIISVSVHDGYAKISVQDDGVGMDAIQLKSLLHRKEGQRTKVGLINTNQRLIRKFGTGLEIKSTPNQGTVVSFIVEI